MFFGNGQLGARVDDVVFPIRLDRLHKRFGQAYADVKVGDFAQVAFALDEFDNIRVIHAQYAHVGTAPCTALLYRLCCGVEHLHEADGA